MISYNSYNPNNYIYYQEGDLIIAQSNAKNVSINILKGIVINNTIGGNMITVKRYGYEQTYVVPVNSIVVHVPCTYPKFEEVKAEMLSMSSEDGKDYEHLYNIYKTIDNAKYYVGYYIFYKTEDDCTENARTALITKLNIDSDDTAYYELINTEGNNIMVYESDIVKRSTYEDYQKECKEFEMRSCKKLEETMEEHNIAENNNDLQTTNSYITSTVDSTYDRIDNNVSCNRLDELEEKHKKAEKLLKLGISLLLGEFNKIKFVF